MKKEFKQEIETYFNVFVKNYNTFNLDDFCNKLALKKEDIIITNVIPNPNSKHLKIAPVKGFDYDINVMLEKTISCLIGKEQILLDLKTKYNLTYYLEKVVHLKQKEVLPTLSMNRNIIEFLYKSGTDEDLDLYII